MHRLGRMGIKYHMDVKDHKLDQRFQMHVQRDNPDAAKPGMRTPKKLSKKAAARLAAKQAETDAK